jgi:hypothetical protein
MENKDRFVICDSCATSDETSPACNSCVSGSNFERKVINCTEDCTDCTECIEDCTECIEDCKAKEKNEYRKDSVVYRKKDRIYEIVNAHWAYIENVIKSAATDRMFTLKEIIEMREFDYKSAARHFYGHGYEDGTLDMAKKTVDRLKE